MDHQAVFESTQARDYLFNINVCNGREPIPFDTGMLNSWVEFRLSDRGEYYTTSGSIAHLTDSLLVEFNSFIGGFWCSWLLDDYVSRHTWFIHQGGHWVPFHGDSPPSDLPRIMLLHADDVFSNKRRSTK